jgi:hypothetical protein
VDNREQQSVIDAIRRDELSEEALIRLLSDPRMLVRANVLMALPRRKLSNSEAVVDAVVGAATDPVRAKIKLMGTLNQRKLAVATLAWLQVDPARRACEALCAEMGDDEREDVMDIVKRGPIT